MSKKIISYLAVLAFFIQALIPAGFMPSFDSNKVGLVICTAQGEKTIYIDFEQGDEHDHSSGQELCNYAISFSKAVTPDLIESEHSISYSVVEYTDSILPQIALHTSSVYQSRGPPKAAV